MVERLSGALDRHHGFHTTRAELLARVGRSDDALVAYDRAIALAANSAEVAHLIRRRSDLRHRTEGETP
jgi:RNA polymerase sigma-70 factor (ECF subfamily)